MVSQSSHCLFCASACPGATFPEDCVVVLMDRKAEPENLIPASQVWAGDFEFLTEKNRLFGQAQSS
jgi:hypothetical protein